MDRFGKPRREIAKVALGAEYTVAWEKITRIAPLLKKLKKEGFTLCAIEQNARSFPYYKIRLKKQDRARTALIVGNEVKGLLPSLLARADTILEIPMEGEKESLNVAVAFGVVAFHLLHD